MAGYLGNTQKISGRYTVDEFTSSGGTTYTLSSAPGDKNNMQVSAGGLVQYPSAYCVSGTTLTLTGVPSGQKVVVRHMGDTIPFPLLDDNVVTTAKIAAGAVGTTDIADDAVTLAKLSATGTASASNFLRGDNSWQAAGGGAWTLLGSTNVTSAVSIIEFTGIDATYNTLVLVASELVPTDDNKSLRLQLGDNSSYPTSYSKSGIHRWGIGETSPNYSDNGAGAGDSFELITGGVGNATGEGCSGVWYINGTSSSSAYPTVHGESIIIEDGSGQGRKCSFIGQFVYATQITKLKIYYLANTTASGRASLFGLKHT